jgi:hypothetical protein
MIDGSATQVASQKYPGNHQPKDQQQQAQHGDTTSTGCNGYAMLQVTGLCWSLR